MIGRVLLVAPTSDLELAGDEIAAIVQSGLRVYKLAGAAASRQNVLQAIGQARANGDPFGLVWFVAHGTLDGILLENGTLDGSSLTAYVRSGEIRGVVLNTCESIAIANAIVQESGADVVATIQPVPDVTAYETGAILASQLATGATLRQAYRQSKPGRNDNYIFLDSIMTPGTNRLRQVSETDSDAVILRQIREALLGNPYNRNERGLLADFAAMVEGQAAAAEERERISSRVTFLSHVSLVQSIVLFAIVVVLAGILVYLGQRGQQGQLAPEPPAASMQYPHKATVERESTVHENGNLPVRYNGDTDANNRYADGGKERAVGVAGFVGVLFEPFPVFVPYPQIQQPAEEQA